MPNPRLNENKFMAAMSYFDSNGTNSIFFNLESPIHTILFLAVPLYPYMIILLILYNPILIFLNRIFSYICSSKVNLCILRRTRSSVLTFVFCFVYVYIHMTSPCVVVMQTQWHLFAEFTFYKILPLKIILNGLTIYFALE